MDQVWTCLQPAAGSPQGVDMVIAVPWPGDELPVPDAHYLGCRFNIHKLLADLPELPGNLKVKRATGNQLNASLAGFARNTKALEDG